MDQYELLKLLQQYNSTDKHIIKKNLKIIMTKKDIKAQDIINLGYNSQRVYSWTKTVGNVPEFEDALKLAIYFNFDITDLLQPIN